MDGLVPVINDIKLLYPPDAVPVQEERFERLIAEFSRLYGRKPSCITRSPGRVNLIGEHIDYSLYEVLPMAIAADVLIAVCALPEERNVRLNNLNFEKFKPGQFTIPEKGNIEIDSATLQWTNYFKAGFKGALGFLQKEAPAVKLCGMQILADGNVPAGGGLSSSAAFVCASALATLRANGLEKVPKKELVELAIVSERSVGVNSGGMDQAASVFSIRGDATSVCFFPQLDAQALPFPNIDPPITFMIAQSFVAADKHVAAPEQYNLRVVECTLAAEVLAAKMGDKIKADSGPLGTSLRGCQQACFENLVELPFPDGDEQLKRMLTFTEKLLDKPEGYTRDDIASGLSLTVPALEEKFMTKFPVRAERFYLRQRAQHVFTEALRVQAFKNLLQSPPVKAVTSLLPKLGAILNESHASSRDVYAHSCPEIDEMCEIALEAGSYGGRVTGAGWGGCSVHLVPKEKVDAVRAAWEEKYYRKREPGITREKLAEAVVVSEPGHGAMVYVTPITRRARNLG
ncbi:galactokinase [Puttea exsequens]|nr:galactokinase [Puttea exsequens]